MSPRSLLYINNSLNKTKTRAFALFRGSEKKPYPPLYNPYFSLFFGTFHYLSLHRFMTNRATNVQLKFLRVFYATKIKIISIKFMMFFYLNLISLKMYKHLQA